MSVLYVLCMCVSLFLPPSLFQVVSPDGEVVVKRGRGRPPGRRNKATLIAQAKLLAQQQAKTKAVSSQLLSQPPPVKASPAQSLQHNVSRLEGVFSPAIVSRSQVFMQMLM